MTGTRGRRMRVGAVLAVAWMAGGASGVATHAAAEQPGRIERIHLKPESAATKVIIMLSRPLPFDVQVLDADAAAKRARRVVLDFPNTTLAPEVVAPVTVDDGFVRQIRTGQFTASTARVVLELAAETRHAIDAYETPPHVTIAVADASAGSPPTLESAR